MPIDTKFQDILPGPSKLTKSVGAPNLIPEKYRRLIKTIDTNQPVGADYVFPDGLVGDQAFLERAQDEISTVRLHIIEEIIDVGESLLGSELSEWGDLTIYESIVDEGTPADEGFNIVRSSVTALGNGKSIKISVQYPADLASKALLHKTLGQENLTPEKYRRLIKRTETETLVPSATYVFPTLLTGDQAKIDYAEETISRARLKILDEIIAIDADPLAGSELSEWGDLTIYETIVDEGTPAFEGYNVVRSSVTPLGNGKSVLIAVFYPIDILSKELLTKTLGQENLTPAKYRRLVKTVETNTIEDINSYTFPNVLTGDESRIEYVEETITRARLKILEEIINLDADPIAGEETSEHGKLSIEESIVDEGDPIDEGFLIIRSSVTPLGNGKSIKITASVEEFPVLESDLFDDEMRVRYDETREVVPAGTAAGALVDGQLEEIRAENKYRSLRIITPKSPDAVDEASAIVTYQYRAHQFPGRINIPYLDAFGTAIGYRKPFAELVQVKVRTWWETGATAPVIAVDEIFPDTITINGVQYENVLHDAALRVYNFSYVYLRATTPSYTNYVGQLLPRILTGDLTFTNGSTTVTGSGTLFTTELIVGDYLGFFATVIVDSITDDVTLELDQPYSYPTGTYSGIEAWTQIGGWIGQEKIMGAIVVPAKEPNLWKVETQSVVMR